MKFCVSSFIFTFAMTAIDCDSVGGHFLFDLAFVNTVTLFVLKIIFSVLKGSRV